jgi:DNA repair exonuclease SbcCD nuclease subunit
MPAEEFRFAHLADAHVGAWPRDPAIRRALRESVLRALAVVDERDCEFLLISGDLFHTPVPDPAEVAPVAAALRTLIGHGRRVYVIYGSHDYVAHRTSWLDVLAETGIFLRAAPEAVRAEGDRWSLPFVVDPPTGARIAGISGRSHGLDRGYFLAVDSEAFRAEPGYKIFQFHAAVQEFLPEHLRDHIQGISKEDLPGGCDYYAGGHIHFTYQGNGPDGSGILVNPGAVLGTSVTDVENGALGRTKQGIVIATVRGGRTSIEYVETATKDVRVFDVDLDGRTAEAAREVLDAEVESRQAKGRLLFPRVHGTLADGGAGTLGLHRPAEEGGEGAAGAIHWDVTDLSTVPASAGEIRGTAEEVEAETVRVLSTTMPSALGSPESAEPLLRALLHELGTAPAEGESKLDYESQRLSAVRRILGLRSTDGA